MVMFLAATMHLVIPNDGALAIPLCMLYTISSMIAMINIGAMDAFNMRYTIKIILCAVCALLMMVLSLTCQFGTLCADVADHDIKYLQNSSSRILAKFMWRQAIMTLLRKNDCALLKNPASVKWVNDPEKRRRSTNLSEQDHKSVEQAMALTQFASDVDKYENYNVGGITNNTQYIKSIDSTTDHVSDLVSSEITTEIVMCLT